MARIPEIVLAHHEKLNGKGYPRALAAELIPFEAQLISVADIFDALSARDRPYKKAVPVKRSLDILQMEVNAGALHPGLVKLFVDYEVYHKGGFEL